MTIEKKTDEKKMEEEKVSEQGGSGSTSLEKTVEERIEEIIDNVPKEEPVTMSDVSQLLDERLTKMEESLAAKFVQMGGVINNGSKEIEEKKVNVYTPLSELDYSI